MKPDSSFSLQKFLNRTSVLAVFMTEGRRVAMGEAILGHVTTTDGSIIDRSHLATTNDRLEDMVRDHSRMVYRIAYAVLRRHHDAEDATQEAFMRVLRYSSRLDDVKDPKTWLARIAWRVAVDRSRRYGVIREISLDDPEKPSIEVASPEAGADQAFLGTQIGSALEKLIAALPRKLREPLILSTVEEMSPREIAATLNLSEAAVRSRVFRARQILKEKLAQFAGSK